MKKIVILLIFALFNLIAFAQSRQTIKQIKVFPDEYSELDDVPVTKQIEDPFVLKTLERARIKYLRALSFIEKKDTLQAEENFEQAIDILNSISFYPNINKFRDYTDLIQSILEDYERYIRNIDHLDESSSLFILRETLTKELDRTARTKPTQIGTLKPTLKDTSKTIDKNEYTFQIPMDDNEYVKKSIEFLTQKPIGRKFVRNSLARSTVWGGVIKKIIEEEKMPPEIFYLAMVESGFNPFAVSRAKAVGIWQFIMSTGQLYGLNSTNSPWIDERRDPIKSTRAAMRHLRDLYNELGDWHLAIAAYNCGINAVQRAIAKFNNPDSVNFWNIMPFLPRETRNYVPLFIATVKVVTNLEAYGFSRTEIEYQPEIQFDKYIIKEPVSLNALAKCANVSIEKMKELNPELLFSFTPPDIAEYELRIPFGTKQTFIANFLNLTDEEKQPFLIYKTEKKESISSIAEKFNLNPREILLLNNWSSTTKPLPKGTTLRIPIVSSQDVAKKEEENGASTAPGSIPESRNSLASPDKGLPSKSLIANQGNYYVIRYIIKENDNLNTISQKFNTTVDSIIKWNELKTRVLTPGRTLRIYTTENYYNQSNAQKTQQTEPTRNEEQPKSTKFENVSFSKSSTETNDERNNAKTTTKIHRIRKGETLQTIANSYGISVSKLLELNPQLKKRKNSLLVGETIKVVVTNKKQQSGKKDSASNSTKNKKTKYHIVRKGETLSDISKRYGLTVNEIISLNPKIKPNKIKYGDKIRIN